ASFKAEVAKTGARLRALKGAEALTRTLAEIESVMEESFAKTVLILVVKNAAMISTAQDTGDRSYQLGFERGFFGPEADHNIARLDDGRFADDVGTPGRLPFTRGIFPSTAGRKGGQRPTVRKYSSYGTPDESNLLLKDQRKKGATGFSIAFDL